MNKSVFPRRAEWIILFTLFHSAKPLHYSQPLGILISEFVIFFFSFLCVVFPFKRLIACLSAYLFNCLRGVFLEFAQVVRLSSKVSVTAQFTDVIRSGKVLSLFADSAMISLFEIDNAYSPMKSANKLEFSLCFYRVFKYCNI